MKLCYIGLPDISRTQDTQFKAKRHLTLAKSLNFHLAYFPNTDPTQLDMGQNTTSSATKIAFDASAFGKLTPTEVENAVRRVNDSLDGNLYVGVKMCGANASPQCKAQAQAFETLFSYDPRAEQVFGQTRFPMKPPCPTIIGLPVTGTSHEARDAAARGYHPMTPGWQLHRDIARIWPAIVGGATSAVRRACQSQWHVNRVVVVHDNSETLDAYIYGSNSPIRRHFAGLAQRGLIGADIDTHLRRVVIAGCARKVGDDILALREAVGEFGVLNIIDPAGSDCSMIRNTMVRLVEDVMPLVATCDISQLKNLERA
jgi:hypothetical protein